MPACTSGDGNEAVFVGTMLQTGDAVALCDQCLVGWAAALLNVMTGVDPTPFIAAISDDVSTVDLGDPPAATHAPLDPDAETDPPPQIGLDGRTSPASRGHGTGGGRRERRTTIGADEPPAAA